MKRAGRFVAGIALFAIVGVLVAALAYRFFESPRLDGRLTVAGLAASVDVVRDAAGVPHIYAASEDDAWFALGFVHAQDRLWQMELDRRTAAGRLAEVLGRPALETDRFLRTIGVARNATAIAASLDGGTRHRLERYAAGVNANLALRATRWPLTAPIEFVLTRAPMPQRWTPADSIGWVTMMAWDLSGNINAELMRMRLSERLTKRQIDEFLPPYPGNAYVDASGHTTAARPDAVLPTMDYVAFYRGLRSSDPSLSTAMRDASRALVAMGPMTPVEGKGSNNWVVAGSRSTSGKPLLANDPHLGLSTPSLWYLAQVSWPGHDVIGATLPGVPFIVIGRNRRIGWGLTNTGPDTQDLYIEALRSHDGRVEARTPDGWQPLDERHETIRVAGEPDVDLVVRTSRHGPLLSDASRGGRAALATIDATGVRYALAFQWAALRPDDRTMRAGFALGMAQDWPSFVDAVRDFDAPEQNIVYADVDGDIAFIAPGRVPLRKPDNDLMGLAPAPGWDARYDWDGFVAFDDLPRLVNPTVGRIVTANQRVVDDAAAFLTSEWTPPFRARRIEALLDAKPRHDVASFAAIQADVVSLAVRRLLPILLRTPPADDEQKAAIARLANWDGAMAADRPEPAIYAAWMRELTRLVMQDELGPELFDAYWDQRTVFMIDVLSDVDGRSRWCDDVTTPVVETCATMQARALRLALADLAHRLGDDHDAWRWDRLHVARSEHRPFGRVASLAPLFDLAAPIGGDSNTVDVGGYTIANEREPFAARHGPSLRTILDFADLERSRFIQSTGQSGDRLSPQYGDFVERWRAVDAVPMQVERRTVERGALGTLTLVP